MRGFKSKIAQAVNARFKFRDVLVGPFDFQTGTIADRHLFSPIAL